MLGCKPNHRRQKTTSSPATVPTATQARHDLISVSTEIKGAKECFTPFRVLDHFGTMHVREIAIEIELLAGQVAADDLRVKNVDKFFKPEGACRKCLGHPSGDLLIDRLGQAGRSHTLEGFVDMANDRAVAVERETHGYRYVSAPLAFYI